MLKLAQKNPEKGALGRFFGARAIACECTRALHTNALPGRGQTRYKGIIMKGHFLILGGARSGKSALAERIATGLGRTPAYLATAEALDAEMEERVAAHQLQRQGRFTTYEEPLDLPGAILSARSRHDFILVDCLTLWITNLLGAGDNVTAAVDDLISVLETTTDAQIVLVSNEVGLGIVPDNPLARTFRDLTGATHQRAATVCAHVYLVAAGIPMALKGKLPPAD